MPIRPDFQTDEEWHAHLRIWLAGQALSGMVGRLLSGDVATRSVEHADELMQLLLWPTTPNGIA
jgi:hypothetical protein